MGLGGDEWGLGGDVKDQLMMDVVDGDKWGWVVG